jgi:hypothetical protein
VVKRKEDKISAGWRERKTESNAVLTAPSFTTLFSICGR